MRKRIKSKILSGFVIVICMLAAAGGVSIYEFVRISNLVQALIKDNYKTIQAGKSMLEALERKDSGVLLLLLGQFNQGTEVLKSADTTFRDALTIAANNVTEVGEKELIEQIRKSYQNYHASIDRADDMDSVNNLQWYQDVVHKNFLSIKNLVHTLINLNQDAMFHEATQLEQQSKRALMPGIIAISASLIFLLLLNFFISKYFVQPILRLTRVIRKYLENPQGILIADIESEDELRELGNAVEDLVQKLKQ